MPFYDIPVNGHFCVGLEFDPRVRWFDIGLRLKLENSEFESGFGLTCDYDFNGTACCDIATSLLTFNGTFGLEAGFGGAYAPDVSLGLLGLRTNRTEPEPNRTEPNDQNYFFSSALSSTVPH